MTDSEPTFSRTIHHPDRRKIVAVAIASLAVLAAASGHHGRLARSVDRRRRIGCAVLVAGRVDRTGRQRRRISTIRGRTWPRRLPR